MTTQTIKRMTVLAVAAVALGFGTYTPPARAGGNFIDVTITDNAFEPAEGKATVGKPFILRFHNKSAVAAEVESHDLRFEKVVPKGRDVIVKVRPRDAGTYIYYNDFKPTVRGQVVIGE